MTGSKRIHVLRRVAADAASTFASRSAADLVPPLTAVPALATTSVDEHGGASDPARWQAGAARSRCEPTPSRARLASFLCAPRSMLAAADGDVSVQIAPFGTAALLREPN